MNETTKIFKKNLDINVQDFVYLTALDLKVEEDSYDQCFTCGNWAGEVIELKNIGNNEFPSTIRVGLNCAEYFELPDNASALLLSVQRKAMAEAERIAFAKAIAEFKVKEPQLAQMGEFLSSINDWFYSKFRNIKYELQADYVEWLREKALEVWQQEVDELARVSRMSKRVQLNDGLQEVTAKVEKVYFAETQWGGQERLVLNANDNTLFVNVTKALEEVNVGDTITIELEVTMFETAKGGYELAKTEHNPNGHTFTGMGKAGRRKLINHIKA